MGFSPYGVRSMRDGLVFVGQIYYFFLTNGQVITHFFRDCLFIFLLSAVFLVICLFKTPFSPRQRSPSTHPPQKKVPFSSLLSQILPNFALHRSKGDFSPHETPRASLCLFTFYPSSSATAHVAALLVLCGSLIFSPNPQPFRL